MLYLINETFFDKTTREVIDLLKIGYTGDSGLDTRLSAYINHCPEAKLLFTIPGGDLKHESALLDKFRIHLYKGREWFEYSDEIVDYFRYHTTLESLADLGVSEKPGALEFKKEVTRVINLLLNYKVSQGDITLEIASRQVDNLVNQVLSDRRIKTIPDLWEYIKRVFGVGISILIPEIKSETVSAFLTQFDGLSQFTDKMKLLCDNVDQFTRDEFESILNSINIIFKNYFITLGKDRIRSLQYKKSVLETEYERIKINQGKFGNLQEVIYSTFLVDEKYTKVYIKDKLSEIYDSCNIKSSPKATDLENYFEVKKIQITNKETRKKDHGYKLISKKNDISNKD